MNHEMQLIWIIILRSEDTLHAIENIAYALRIDITNPLRDEYVGE
jgi:hypothetical protein